MSIDPNLVVQNPQYLNQDCAEKDDEYQSLSPNKEVDEAIFHGAEEPAYEDVARDRDSPTVDEVAPKLEDCPGAESSHIAEPSKVEHDAASDDYFSFTEDEDPPAAEFAMTANSPECRYYSAEEVIWPVAPIAQDDAAPMGCSTAIDTMDAPTLVGEEPSSESGPAEAIGEGFEVPPPVRSSQAPLAPIKEPQDVQTLTKNYAVVLKMLHGTEVLTSMASLESATKTAILLEAQATYAKHLLQYELEEVGWKTMCNGTLLSVQMDSLEVNLSTYDAEDLTFLIETFSHTAVPIFTVDISQQKR